MFISNDDDDDDYVDDNNLGTPKFWPTWYSRAKQPTRPNHLYLFL